MTSICETPFHMTSVNISHDAFICHITYISVQISVFVQQYMYLSTFLMTHSYVTKYLNGVATIRRLLKSIGLFCKRAL